jgi:hypothetical protein
MWGSASLARWTADSRLISSRARVSSKGMSTAEKERERERESDRDRDRDRDRERERERQRQRERDRERERERQREREDMGERVCVRKRSGYVCCIHKIDKGRWPCDVM